MHLDSLAGLARPRQGLQRAGRDRRSSFPTTGGAITVIHIARACHRPASVNLPHASTRKRSGSTRRTPRSMPKPAALLARRCSELTAGCLPARPSPAIAAGVCEPAVSPVERAEDALSGSRTSRALRRMQRLGVDPWKEAELCVWPRPGWLTWTEAIRLQGECPVSAIQCRCKLANGWNRRFRSQTT